MREKIIDLQILTIKIKQRQMPKREIYGGYNICKDKMILNTNN